jgi:ribosome-binding factor A
MRDRLVVTPPAWSGGGRTRETRMSLRSERVANLIRNTVGELLLSKISDPRIDPARTSITHVEVAEDLLTAKIFVSVMGSEAEQRRALHGLRHAAGRIQDLMMRQIQLRNTPALSFVADVGFKKGLKTLELIRRAMDEIDQKQKPDEGED